MNVPPPSAPSAAPAAGTSGSATAPLASSSAAAPQPPAASGSSSSNAPATAPDGSAPTAAQQKARRAFKACAHCRARKAKCDLGDLDSPKEPPCARCRREGVRCEFLPSRRGGRVPFAKQKRNENKEESEEPTVKEPTPEPERESTTFVSSAMGHIGSLASNSANRPHDFAVAAPYLSSEIGRAAQRFPPTIPVPPPITQGDIFRHGRLAPKTDGRSPNQGSDASPTESFSDGRAPSDASGQRKKRRRESGHPADPETLAAASLRNPVDALDLLLAAADPKGARRMDGTDTVMEEGGSNGGKTVSPHEHLPENGVGGDIAIGPSPGQASAGGKTNGAEERREEPVVPPPPAPKLEDFPLVKKGVMSTRKLCELVDTFFSRMHFIFPVVPWTRVPRSEAALAKFAAEELHLVTVFCVIASRHDKNPRVHDKSWAYLQTLINEIMLGKSVSVGAVESLLLLSEWLPRQPETAAGQINAEENRMSWMLVGTAVRLGYMMGLDSKTLTPAQPFDAYAEHTESEEILNRERVAWTYCYMFDRQISIRTGKAFWSRGPQLCFTGGSGGVYPTATNNFPSLRFVEDTQDDFASLLQAYVELTQIMTSCHDILYPSRERTVSMIRLGEYYKFLDEFTRSLDSFRTTWEGKRWATYPLTECIWITFHYLRLYIYGFAFQAHVQRATSDANSDDETTGPSLFPAGLTASPDAKFILEAIDAAADLLRLVTDRLHPGGALPFLPWRFFMMFSYAGVFLLKAVYVEAVAPMDRQVILRVLKRLIFVLACASTDEQHPGVRYARLLNGLLRAFSQGQESAAQTRAPTPLRRNSLPGGAEAPVINNLPTTTTAPAAPALEFSLPWALGTDAIHATPLPGHVPADLYPASTFGAPFPATFPPLAANPTAPQAIGTTPFPMLPFSESQPFHQLASSMQEPTAADDQLLNWDLDANLGLPADGSLLPNVAANTDVFNNFLLEDSALDFWTSFSAPQDWSANNGAGTGTM